MGIASTGSQAAGGGFSSSTIPGSSGPAAPASGTKYGGFGSEDIAKFGYNKSDQFGGGPYDPYTKTQSTTTGTTSNAAKADKKPQNKKALDAESDDDSDSDQSSVDSDDSEAQRKKKKRDERKAKKAAAAKAALEPAKTEEAKTEAPKPAPLGGLGAAPKAGRTFQGTQPVAQAEPKPQAQAPAPQAPAASGGGLLDLLGGNDTSQANP